MDALDLLEIIPDMATALDEKPQFGLSAPFPLDELQNKLRTLFDRVDLTLTTQDKGWIKKEEAFNGIGEKILPLTLFFSPIREPIYFLTSEQDLASFMNELFLSKEAAAPFANPSYIQGFYHFLAVEITNTIQKLETLPGLSPRIGENPPSLHEAINSEEVFCIDVTCILGAVAIHGRVLITPLFRKELKENYFKSYKPQISAEKAAKVPVEVSIVAGYTQLLAKEWKKAKKGDLILLDRLLYDIEKRKGKVALNVGGKTFFRGKVQENGIKLLENPLYAEVFKSMDEKFEDDEMFSDLNEEEEIAELEDTNFEMGEEGEKEHTEEEERVSVEQATTEENFSIEQVPLTLSVEVARVKMSLEELMKLESGNLLDLKVQPEAGVNLVINDKTVGRGELVKLGDFVGVRIVQL